ncbi:MAG: tRNA uracil 4-sulfurtransferase ThiI [Gemmatimonadota bacterium]|nr:tRNA uracil 4-sulfurtransferase ThiI [Gemmatimonadota bacterium]
MEREAGAFAVAVAGVYSTGMIASSAAARPPGNGSADAPGVVAMVRLTGEVTTKSRRTRLRFQRRLARNIAAALRRDSAGEPDDFEIREEWSRFYVRVPEADRLEPLARVFGVSSYSVLDGSCPADLEAIVSLGTRLYGEAVQGRRFAVRVRRRGSQPFRSRDIAVQLGAALNPGATVDLDDPDVEVRVEVRDDRAFLFSSRVEGAGGLPLGAEGRAVALLSGGFDSAVAAWMMLRRGVSLEYVFCNLAGEAYRRMVLEVAHVLADRWSAGAPARIHVVDFRGVVDDLRRAVPGSLLQVMLKRRMYAAAAAIGRTGKAQALVTGESVGQVSSQTLANLRVIDDASDVPVLRPLVGMDKEEIVARSRRIGTYELSARVREHCAISDGRTATAARPTAVRAAAAALGPAVLARAVKQAERIDLHALELSDVAADALFVDTIPPGAVGVDMRPAAARVAAPWPGAVPRSFAALSAGFGDLDDRRTHVLVCERGLLSAQVAERMQAEGREAYSLRGGDRQLRALLAAAGGAGGPGEEEGA